MDIKYVECDDCGVIFNDIDDLDVMYRLESFKDKKYTKMLCCPYCECSDTLRFIIGEGRPDELPEWDIKVYCAELFNDNNSESEISYRPVMAFKGGRICFFSGEGTNILGFDTFAKAEEKALEIKENTSNKILEGDKEIIKGIKECYKSAEEFNPDRLYSIEHYKICNDCGKRIDTDKDVYYVRNNTDTSGSEIVCEKCARG